MRRGGFLSFNLSGGRANFTGLEGATRLPIEDSARAWLRITSYWRGISIEEQDNKGFIMDILNKIIIFA